MSLSKERWTSSICPECRKPVDARIFARGERVLIEKECPEHGRFEDVYWSDAQAYRRVEDFACDGAGLENPRTGENRGCPFDCGICPRHRSHTLLGIIDVTNRCNLRCPVCFADAAPAGSVYEPTRDEVRAMLDNLRSNRPVPTPAVQFSGGEPTLREDLPDLIRLAKTLGFLNVQVNTNGIKLSQSPDYCRTLKDAGMDTVYLQFDGLTPDVYRFTRGRDLVDVKMKALENCRRADMRSVVLVVTLVKGINDHQLGDIIRFAAANFDVVRCINVQPLSFTGRVPKEELKDRRLTIPDFMAGVERQTGGAIRASDFYPVPSVLPVSQAAGLLTGERYPEFTAHPHCGMATYFVPYKGTIRPINRTLDVEKILAALRAVVRTDARGRKGLAKAQLLMSLRHVKGGWLRKYLWSLLKKGSFETLRDLHFHLIMLSAMHFMDAYNFDAERVRRCVIHYALPDGRLIPFCSYNNLGYRDEIERTFGSRDSAARSDHAHP